MRAIQSNLDIANSINEKNRRGNQEWTIQRNWQHWVHRTQDEDKQNKKHNTICVGYTRHLLHKTQDEGKQTKTNNNKNTQHNICWTPLFLNKHK